MLLYVQCKVYYNQELFIKRFFKYLFKNLQLNKSNGTN